jgi:adenine-specific DNA-methyltransferase
MNSKYKKLELCWLGKDIEVKPEPRVLIEDPEKSYGESDTENMLIHADNLLALKALEQSFSEQIKCIYIDPPYNTGQAFEHYEDGLEHSIWLNLMKSRLFYLRKLLRKDGTIFVQLDDNEVSYCRVLMDEIFGRNNFVNQISVKMKNTAGASGGGEDKRLKKNIEFILIYAKDYDNSFVKFNDVYEEENLFDVIDEMEANNQSWKYTSILQSKGNFIEERIVKDGSGENIVVRKYNQIKRTTVNKLQSERTREDIYIEYFDTIFSDTNAQTSIRQRIIDEFKELKQDELLIASYIPKSGRDKGQTVFHYYLSPTIRRVIWLKDSCEKRGKFLFKKEKLGTYWSGFPLNNLTKEGGVQFPNGKKPESLIQRILELSTNEGDWVLDSFLGSGSTAATAHKMKRKYIGIELGQHCNTHCLPRLQVVCDGTDQGGISKVLEWKGGGGFKFYNLAPSLLNKDRYNQWVINPNYNADLLAAAMARHEGFSYSPDDTVVWKQGFATENHFIFTTTNTITPDVVEQILSEMKPEESLRICCTAFIEGCNEISSRIEIKKIPEVLLGKCEFGKEDYCTDTNIINMPADPDKPAFTPSFVKPDIKPEPAKIKKDTPTQTKLLF